MSPVVVLVGPPGSGKSTVGRRLAARLGVPFMDTDHEVERLAGRTIAEIFASDGEECFRRMESEVLIERLSSHEGVLSLGGGAVLKPENRAALAGHRVAWLDLEPDLAVRRVGRGKGRPLLEGADESRIRSLMAEREPFYREVATWRLRSSEGAPDRVVREIERLLDVG